ncbi:PREDICTED: NXPE family member 3-like [Branchiostoma belcheri]|uniref:NXPE family member 3-like n=1 Tax=Branchiostoma belcheri TaxID=7741 RepID=A0A6P4XUQ5_BRABE|nr:PREDICTED: NXPE family member 3-like [Branchiostoma belcheri]
MNQDESKQPYVTEKRSIYCKSKESPMDEEMYANQIRSFLEFQYNETFIIGDILRIVVSVEGNEGNLTSACNVGDYLRASISSVKTKSGAVGIITDHGNGTYTATFRLLWAGDVHMKIQLVHSHQAIDVIKRTVMEHPIDKVMFQKTYTVGKDKIYTRCNVDPAIFNKTTPICDYSDPHAGASWYCEKASNISCNTPGYHSYLSTNFSLLRNGEEVRFGRGLKGIKWKVYASPSPIKVIGGLDPLANRTRCKPGLPTNQISGFYEDRVWNSLVCQNRHFSSQSEWGKCLRGKTLHLMGDSTIRQWYEHLVEILNITNSILPEGNRRTGPMLARDTINNITVQFRAHGPPLRCPSTPTFHLEYVTNVIDKIDGGPNDVVGITVWAHFTSYPVDMYRERMEAIRAAIQRLHQRNPKTLVVIKSANTQRGYALIGADWLARELDLIMRKTFKGMRVVLVDAWEMTTAQQWYEDEIHPASDIIIQELEFLCSFVCPL